MVPLLSLILTASQLGTIETVRIDCPDWIYTRQDLAVEVQGWEGWETTYPAQSSVEDPGVHRHGYSGVGFYQEHPSNHMMLRADSSAIPLTYTFGDGMEVWAACGYRGTVITFVKHIGPGISHCLIVQEESKHRSKNVGICYRR